MDVKSNGIDRYGMDISVFVMEITHTICLNRQSGVHSKKHSVYFIPIYVKMDSYEKDLLSNEKKMNGMDA